jgi:hypothetical protein
MGSKIKWINSSNSIHLNNISSILNNLSSIWMNVIIVFVGISLLLWHLVILVAHSIWSVWDSFLLNSYVSSFSLILIHGTKYKQCSSLALGFGVSNYRNFEFI